METQQEQSRQPDYLLPAEEEPVPISKLIELRAKGLTYKEIGKVVNRCKQTIHERLQPYVEHIDGLKSFKDNRADILAIQQSKLLLGNVA